MYKNNAVFLLKTLKKYCIFIKQLNHQVFFYTFPLLTYFPLMSSISQTSYLKCSNSRWGWELREVTPLSGTEGNPALKQHLSVPKLGPQRCDTRGAGENEGESTNLLRLWVERASHPLLVWKATLNTETPESSPCRPGPPAGQRDCAAFCTRSFPHVLGLPPGPLWKSVGSTCDVTSSH